MAIITPEYEQIVQGITKRHKMAVWSILSQHIGVENKIGREDLVRCVRVIIDKKRYNERGVRKIIEDFRNAGISIPSDREGYWIGTPMDTYEWSLSYKAHALTMLSTMHRLMRVAIKLDVTGEIRRRAQKEIDEVQLTLNLEGIES
jgi:hypothetical protein